MAFYQGRLLLHKLRRLWLVFDSSEVLLLSYSGNLQESEFNPFTKRSHTPQYKKILESRKKLPVFSQMDEFLKMVRPLNVFSLYKGRVRVCFRRSPPQVPFERS